MLHINEVCHVSVYLGKCIKQSTNYLGYEQSSTFVAKALRWKIIEYFSEKLVVVVILSK